MVRLAGVEVDRGPAWPAPAKLNLFLHVTGRRPDGFHELQTVFQFLDYGDELRFTPRRDGELHRLGKVEGVPAGTDLCLRAARALQQRTGCTQGCDIRIDKRIPLGGGLGGGSSDAATTLVALNRLWDLRLDEPALAGIGVGLGADVPVFIRGTAAWAEGIGEHLTPVSPPEAWYLVVTPPCTVDTREMYNDPYLSRATPRVHWADFMVGRTHNDFEAVARRRHPEVGQALDWAARYGRARLSGSGASVFVAFDTPDAAERIRTQVPAGWRSFVARGINQSPLKTLAVA
ncbi:MAG: 4-(cytidine 5'-diphospho)-2-C-methyl-D-erythritol kinase [Nevskiaceae bacterium]